jgi:hypothetical protein
MATSNYSWNLPTVGGSEDTWGTQLNANWTALDTLLGGTNSTEFAILDGATVTTTELNYLSGVTGAVQTQINGRAATSTLISAGDGLTGGGDLSANRTISHADTSLQASVDNSGTTFIQDITLDTYGHVTGIGSATVPGGIGDGQTWQSVTRTSGTTYQNTTGKPIMLAASRSDGGFGTVNYQLSVDGTTWISSSNLNADNDDGDVNFEVIVPINGYYRINGTFSAVLELR